MNSIQVPTGTIYWNLAAAAYKNRFNYVCTGNSYGFNTEAFINDVSGNFTGFSVVTGVVPLWVSPFLHVNDITYPCNAIEGRGVSTSIAIKEVICPSTYVRVGDKITLTTTSLNENIRYNSAVVCGTSQPIVSFQIWDISTHSMEPTKYTSSILPSSAPTVGSSSSFYDFHGITVETSAPQQLIYHDEPTVMITGTGFNTQGNTLRWANGILGNGVDYTTIATSETSIFLRIVPGSHWRKNVENLPGYLTLVAVNAGEGFVAVGPTNAALGGGS